MCGIYGMVTFGAHPAADPRVLDRMAAALAHRGPDGHGRWCAEGSALGATRLRVVDLDPRADQPFADPAGRAVAVVNGEFYNAATLRQRHASFPFRSQSDVETVIPLYLSGGAEALATIDGMFAVAIWDVARPALILARDRAGEKPLFWTRRGDHVCFASEVAALLADPAAPRRVDGHALAACAMTGYLQPPQTGFAAVRQVPPGSIVVIARDRTTRHRYWRAEQVGQRDDPPTVASLRANIGRAVANQLRADVPVGVFTSGGLDSSLLVSLAAKHLGPTRVTSFTVGFPDRSYDERRFARRLARATQVRHIEIEADAAALRAALSDLLACGEPITDPAALPTLLLARAAKEDVTVVLSGEGGDELFGGYPTYLGHAYADRFARLPASLQRSLAAFLAAIPVSSRRVPLEDLARRFVAAAHDPWPVRHRAWFGSGLPMQALQPEWHAAAQPAPQPDGDPIGRAMRFDYATTLPGRLLVKVDRATMRASLEARAPFLDPQVTRAAFSLPGTAHVNRFRTKRVLKLVARPWVPRFILRRRKRGLSVPIGRWITHDLASEVDRVLSPARLDAQGFFEGTTIARLLADHRAARADHSRGLWVAFVLQLWMDSWGLEVSG